MILNFINPEEFTQGLERIQNILDFEIAIGGIPVELIKGDKSAVSFKNGEGKIYYKEKINVFRNLGIFLENIKEKNEFYIEENIRFDMIGVMLDVAHGGTTKIESLKKYLGYLAAMGYNMLMLYVENSFKIEGNDRFGFMLGAYTKEELKELDDVACDFGIEMIPCLECYGHLGGYLRWDEAGEVKDTPTVLLADEEKTYELIENMIKTSAETFRSNRVHIGMDEAWNMGRGKYMDIHGYVPSMEIFNRHMRRIVDITNKYNLVPMMWSDMYFREAAGYAMGYYDKDSVITDDIKNAVPEEIQLVYWHYGEEPGCDDYMISKHKELNRHIIFAGGTWTWNGQLPDALYANEATKAAMAAVKKHGITEIMTTVWGLMGGDINMFASLLTLSYTAELAYGDNEDADYIRKRFEASTGGNYDAFLEMSYYHNDFDVTPSYKDFNDRYFGRALFWQDVLCGIYDQNLYDKNMSGHYRKHAEIAKGFIDGSKWSYLYENTYNIFNLLALKTEIAERIKPAYDSNDRAELKEIAESKLPELKRLFEVYHSLARKICLDIAKGQAALSLDIRCGGAIMRIDTAILRLKAYLAGEIDDIEELSDGRMFMKTNAFAGYGSLATMNASI